MRNHGVISLSVAGAWAGHRKGGLGGAGTKLSAMKTAVMVMLVGLGGGLLSGGGQACAQAMDTVRVTAKNINMSALIPGPHTYVIYTKASKDGPSGRITLAKINIAEQTRNGQPVVAITQRWELDTVVHVATTLLRKADFSTLSHETYWRRLGYTVKLDFDTKAVTFAGKAVPDSVKQRRIREFNDSFAAYNLNWHSDLVVFSLLPYRARTVFLINFYDPGAGPGERVSYAVTGAETLTNHRGQPVPCWVLQHTLKDGSGYQKFWVDKRSKEVLKEEDLFNGRYRYKLKVNVSES